MQPPSEETIQALVQCFAQTTAAAAEPRKQAEAYLKEAGQRPGYGLVVLQVVARNEVDERIRQAAAVNFKNHIKYRWSPAEGSGLEAAPILEDEKAQIKAIVLELSLNAQPLVRSQLAEALTIVADHDFPAKWSTLLEDLVRRLASPDQKVVNGVLRIANSVFKRFRHQVDSATLAQELKYVLDNFVAPMLALFKSHSQLIFSNPKDVVTLKLLLDSQRLICRIFYSLNYQVLPEVFEDHIKEWMEEFHHYLVYDNPDLVESDPEKESAPNQVKTAICENINLYIQKNEEEFQPYVALFAKDVWNLLLSVRPTPGDDRLALGGMKFLNTIAQSVHHSLFAAPETLKQVCESIIIPNIRLREEDEELFETNYVEYTRRDMEGSDTDTRRRMACELVKGLATHHEAQITDLFSVYVGAMLQEYAANPEANWKAKDCAMYLVLALAVRSRTVAQGATATNALVNIPEFFAAHVQPELLAEDVSTRPVLKADALKFLTTLRAQIPKSAVTPLLPSLIRFLASEANVVHTYAAHAIERLLSLREPASNLPPGAPPASAPHRYAAANVAPVLAPLVSGLFNALTLPESAENAYVMKAIMRVVLVADLGPLGPQVLAQLARIAGEVCRNPTNPSFNHYLFEALAGLIGTARKQPELLGVAEGALAPIFAHVLEADVAEFKPYVFQLLAHLVELRTPPLPPSYMGLFGELLRPVLWEVGANVPALVRLLQAYLAKAPQEIVAGQQLAPVLGVFQKLNASKATDHHGFFVLNAVVERLPLQAFLEFLPHIWSYIFIRLQQSRTPKYTRSFLIFVSLFVAKHGTQTVASSINAIQPGLFEGLLDSVWANNVATVQGVVEPKLCAVATAKVLCEWPPILAAPVWGRLLAATVVLLDQAEEERITGEEDGLEGVDELPGYTAVYAHLHSTGKTEEDPLPEIRDPREFLVRALQKLSQEHPGKVGPMVPQVLDARSQTALGTWAASAGVTFQ